jgi:hypothetical protein
MPLSFHGFIKLLISLLSDEERQGSLAYALEQPLGKGESIRFPGIRVEATARSYLGFIDREPSANWGHPARYMIANLEGGEIQSLEARMPPFQAGSDLRWRLVYQGPGVADALVPHFAYKGKSAVRKEQKNG